MAIDRPLQTPIGPAPPLGDEPISEIQLDLPLDAAQEIVNDDGSVDIIFEDDVLTPVEEIPFEANLAEYLDDDTLGKIAQKFLSLYDSDKMDRREWEEKYKDGLDLLGLKVEERSQPWKGACGINHPLLSEAVVRFQSQQIGEMFPAAGPVRIKLHGKETPELIKQGNRVKNHMNYLLTDQMPEYREEVDKLLFSLPLAGNAFKKTYFDPSLDRAVSEYVPAEDVVVGAGTKSMATCRRLTHVNQVDPNEIRKLQRIGFYADVDISSDPPDIGKIEKKKDELVGIEPTMDNDELVTLLEIHADVDLESFNGNPQSDGSFFESSDGIALPYIITLDKARGQVLSIRRNWLQDDAQKERRQHFTHYQYIPGMGFYGLGLIHLIGGIAKGATSLTRQLIDAGTLSNLPGGYKATGLRIKGDNTPVAAGEWRDVHVPGGKIADSLFPFPYKEPSAVLAQLLQGIVEEGRRFASLTDVNISSMNNEAPVGTTLALLERNLKVMTAISARIHNAARGEMKILASIIRDYYGNKGVPEYGGYPYDTGDRDADLRADYDGRVDVLPVTDPNSSTMAQRIMTMTTALELSDRYPGGYPGRDVLHRKMLNALEIQDIEDILPTSEDIKLQDPVSENQNLLNGMPVKAFLGQDHQAHIQVHMLAMQDPKSGQVLENSPNAQAAMGATMAHVTEHLAFQYRAEMEHTLGMALPPMGEELPPDVEAELSRLIAEAAGELFNRHSAEIQAQEITAKIEDPVLQDTRENTAIKRLQAETRAAEAAAKTELRIAELVQEDEHKEAQLQTEKDIATERIRAQLIGEYMEAVGRSAKIDSDQRLVVAEFLFDMAKEESAGIREELESKVQSGDESMKMLVDLMNKAAEKEE